MLILKCQRPFCEGNFLLRCIPTIWECALAVLKWESEQNRISPALELRVRLYVLNHLRAKDKEFRALYNDINLHQLSKGQKGKIYHIAVDATTEELKIAL